MNVKQKTAVAVGAAVVGAAAALGIGNLVQSGISALTSSSSQEGPSGDRNRDRNNPSGKQNDRQGRQPGGTQQQPGSQQQPQNQQDGQGRQRGAGMASALAEKLGLDETKVSSALDEARNELGRPSDGQRLDPTTRNAQLAPLLAKKLGVDEAKVKAALEELRASR